MKKILLIASAASLVVAGAAQARPPHAKGKGHGNHAGQTMAGPFGYAGANCPPGLAKKSPACIPPGQAKKMFNVGQRVPYGYDGLLGYGALPYDLRQQYGGLDPYSRYIYDQNYLYRVDPTTMIVREILRSVL